MNRGISALAVGGFWLALVPAAQAAPSFDCKKAKAPVEKAICADRKLGDLDRALAEAYPIAQARVGEDASAIAELKASQRSFLSTRNAEFEAPSGDYDLKTHMAARLALLRGIGPDPRRGFDGDWRTTEGSLWVGPPRKDGLRPVNATGQTFDQHGYRCEFLGEARLEGDALIVEGRDKYKKEYDGWRLRLTRKGRLIEVQTLKPEAGMVGLNGSTPICAGTASLGGLFFPRDEVADNPCAGVPAGKCRE